MDPSERPLPIITSAPAPQASNQPAPAPAPAGPVSQTIPQDTGTGLPSPTAAPAGVNQPERLPPLVQVTPYEEPRSPSDAPRNPSQAQREPTARRASPSSIEKIPDDADTLSVAHEIHAQTSPIMNQGIGLGQPLPLAPGRVYDPALRRIRTLDRRFSAGPPLSEIDHIVPTVTSHAKTVYDRLQPTLEAATQEMIKYERKAKYTGWALNAAIGLQVLLGSLTTGLSAVATTGHSSAAVNTTILGALSTIVASYLARARGSNEPELSITRTKDLEQFIRELRAFQLDHGHETGKEWSADVERLRRRFEDLLGNANGERKLSPPV